MKKIFLFLLIVATFQLFGDASEPKICLNMIVKDETPVIKRCLESVKPLIDYWVIVDTGSTDGTQEMIKEFMKDIPGELHERPWVDFAHNRNEALEFAKGKAQYLLLIDADEELTYAKEFKLPPLDKDFYYITTSYGGMEYKRIQLIKNHLNWKWVGVVHEALHSPEAKTNDVLQGITNIARPEGNRSKDPQKFQKDAAAIEKALKEDPTNTRYTFYLAQSYRDAAELEKALATYEKRILMGGWDQEVFWSMLQIGLLKESLAREPNEIIDSYKKAHAYRPTRLEPLYYLARYERKLNHHAESYQASSKGLTLKKPNDLLFVENWIQDYGMLLEYSISSYWTERYLESLVSSNSLLANPSIPPNVRECVEKNLVWINKKIEEVNKADLPSSDNKEVAIVADPQKTFADSIIRKEDFIEEKQIEQKPIVPIIPKDLPQTPAPKIVEETSEKKQDAPKMVEEIIEKKQEAPKIVEEIIEKKQDAPKMVEEIIEKKQEAPKIVEEIIEKKQEAPKQEIEPLETVEKAPQKLPSARELNKKNHSLISNTTPPIPSQKKDTKEISLPSKANTLQPIALDWEGGEPKHAPIYQEGDAEQIEKEYLEAETYLGEEPCYEECLSRSSFTGQIYSGITLGRSIGNVRSYQTVGAYIDWDCGNWLPFIDIRMHNAEDNRWAGNYGVGLRYYEPCTSSILGINAFYDYRRTHASLQQVGIGLEWMTTSFDLTANYYLPISNKNHFREETIFNDLGNSTTIRIESRKALYGGDFEIGTSYNRWAACCSPVDLYLALGGYYYDGDNQEGWGSLTGGKIRAEINIYDLIFLSIQSTTDDIFKTTLQGSVTFVCPFDCTGLTMCREFLEGCFWNQRSRKPAQRNSMIIESRPSFTERD